MKKRFTVLLYFKDAYRHICVLRYKCDKINEIATMNGKWIILMNNYYSGKSETITKFTRIKLQQLQVMKNILNKHSRHVVWLYNKI